MNVRNLDPESTATVDLRAYKQFCAVLGIPPHAFETLEIRLVPDFPKKRHAGAEFRGKRGACLIQVRTRDNQQRLYSPRQLNAYLLHETKHFHDFCATGRCYAPEDLALPHDVRPAEQMARAFVQQHTQLQLIYLRRS